MNTGYIVLDASVDRQVALNTPLPSIGLDLDGVGYVIFPEIGLLLDWLGPSLFECRYEGIVARAPESVIAQRVTPVRRLMLDDVVARLLGAECAHHVLPLYEERHPRDKRLHEVLQAVKAYCGRELSLKELDEAAELARKAVQESAHSVSRAVAKAVFSAASRPTKEREAFYADAGSDSILAARNAACNARWAVEFSKGRGAMVTERAWQGSILAELLNKH